MKDEASLAVDRRTWIQGTFWAVAAGYASAGRAAQASTLSPNPAWMERVKPPPGVTLLPRIKLVVMCARLPTLTSVQFHEYWLTKHAALALEVAGRIKLRRYVQNHEVSSSVAADFTGSRGWKPNTFDGVMEGWWDSEADIMTAFSTPEGMEIARRLIEDERRFSSDQCIGFIAREYLIFGSGAPAR